MKVIERAKTPDGIDIQLEDWSENYSFAGLSIAAYPIAKASRNFARAGEPFKLEIDFYRKNDDEARADYEALKKNDDEARADYEALKSGEKRLEDLAEHFYYHKDDERMLGMITE